MLPCLFLNAPPRPADPWVMRDWAKNLKVDTNVVHMMADGEGMLHSRLGEWPLLCITSNHPIMSGNKRCLGVTASTACTAISFQLQKNCVLHDNGVLRGKPCVDSA
jgi:hypothetical protein